MKKLLYIIVGLVFFIGCKKKEEGLYSSREIRDALNIVLDSALRDTYYGKINYDIRGNFNYEYSDSLIYNSLRGVDTLINKKDITHFIDQYRLLKGKNIDEYINTNYYKKREGARYESQGTINYQFYLSPPLFTLNKKCFITYCIGTAIRPNSFADGFLFLFINENNEWYLYSIIKNDFTTPKNVSSSQSHSFIPASADL
ncbi:MAG TPA: hypothetical protein DCG75_10000 [Bacteroidales bacterium]|nr:hypothetical protein [Bacteroidales bacterium]